MVSIFDFFKRGKDKEQTKEKTAVPEGLWIKCAHCGRLIYREEYRETLKVCKTCGYHFPLSAYERIELLLDENSFIEIDKNVSSRDPLLFKDSKLYRQRVREAIKKTNLQEAFLSGEGKIKNFKVAIGVLDFYFLGGSMGSAVGEKITRLIEYAYKKKLPLIIISSSGGARMQEGILSLMQMAKTSCALAEYKKENLYISILTHPTTGGVAASFALAGDIMIAESGSLIGFAGPRVIAQTIKQKLPDNFQSAEYLLEKGMLDIVIDRNGLKDCLIKILGLYYAI